MDSKSAESDPRWIQSDPTWISNGSKMDAKAQIRLNKVDTKQLEPPSQKGHIHGTGALEVRHSCNSLGFWHKPKRAEKGQK